MLTMKCFFSCGMQEVVWEREGRFATYGYKMPKLVFWNVNSRTNVIPVLSNELEPYACLKKVLDGERYRKVEERLCS